MNTWTIEEPCNKCYIYEGCNGHFLMRLCQRDFELSLRLFIMVAFILDYIVKVFMVLRPPSVQLKNATEYFIGIMLGCCCLMVTCGSCDVTWKQGIPYTFRDSSTSQKILNVVPVREWNSNLWRSAHYLPL